MSIVPFESTFKNNKTDPPEIQLLEIHPRETDDQTEPCVWVFVRREEEYTRDPTTKAVESATITVSYQAVNTDARHNTSNRTGGNFQASYDRLANRISLTNASPYGSPGAVMVHPALRGRRLGTYVFNIIVGWAKQWPSADINKITLSQTDAYPENLERRNQLYEQFGLKFEYADALRNSGSSLPMQPSNLHQVEAWKQNITVHNVTEYLGQILIQNHQLQLDLAARNNTITDLRARMGEQARHPIRTVLEAYWPWRQ